MFARFKIDKNLIDNNLPRVQDIKAWESKEESIKDTLSHILQGENGVIDGNRLMEWCFPLNLEDEYPIFISHSHADINTARALADYIEDKYGLKCFIDSLVWENAFKVLRIIDDLYCQNEEETMYIYSKRNYTTSHVYAMLSLSLMEMIQKTECCILIGNGDSINLNSVREGKTISPWVFEEISYMNNLPICPPRGLPVSERMKNSMKMFSTGGKLLEAREFKTLYSANTTKFLNLDLQDIKLVEQYRPGRKLKKKWLDYLYVKYGFIKPQQEQRIILS